MTDNPTNQSRSGPMLPAAKLWRRTSGKGTEYLAGRLGGVKVLVMPKRDGEEGDHTHTLVFAEAAQRDGGGR
jgi:hypothetical protein